MRRCLLFAMLLGASIAAQAEVKHSAADGFVIEHHYTLAVAPKAAWRALQQPNRWWPADHTWSGDARNLSLKAEAGACFCERWPGSSVEHGRVVMAQAEQLLRINGALGPLQDMAVSAVLTIRLKPVDQGSEATVVYRVSGDSQHQLEKLAPVVDRVLGQQFGEFAKYASAQK